MDGRARMRMARGSALLVALLLLVACGGEEPALTPAVATEVALGQVVYETNCASCHGFQGEGQPNWQRPNPDGTMPAPPHDGSGHTWHHPDQQLLALIAQGGQGPNSAMPGFADSLTPAEMEAVLTYIKTFWSPQQRDAQADISQRTP